MLLQPLPLASPQGFKSAFTVVNAVYSAPTHKKVMSSKPDPASATNRSFHSNARSTVHLYLNAVLL